MSRKGRSADGGGAGVRLHPDRRGDQSRQLGRAARERVGPGHRRQQHGRRRERPIGFAIPSNLVKLLLPQLASKGRVDWGWLGVAIAEVTDDDIGRLKLREPRGVLVRSVMPGEPADKGGVRADDVIVGIDGTTPGERRATCSGWSRPRRSARRSESSCCAKVRRPSSRSRSACTRSARPSRSSAPRRGPRPTEPPRTHRRKKIRSSQARARALRARPG